MEILAATTLLVAVLVLSLRFFHALAQQRELVQQRELALQEAANVVERLNAIEWSDLTARSVQRERLSDDLLKALPGADLQVGVVELPQDPPARRITVALRWPDRSGRMGRPVQLVTWRYEHGPAGIPEEKP